MVSMIVVSSSHTEPWSEYKLKPVGHTVTEDIVVNFENAQDGLQPRKAVPFSSRQFPMRAAAESQHPRRRPRSPGLKWYKPFDGPECFKRGRVLVIDYIKQGK